LLHEPLGQKMILFACVMLVIGVFWMRKIISINM
jgi:Flp pilus assembly protein TadB